MGSGTSPETASGRGATRPPPQVTGVQQRSVHARQISTSPALPGSDARGRTPSSSSLSLPSPWGARGETPCFSPKEQAPTSDADILSGGHDESQAPGDVPSNGITPVDYDNLASGHLRLCPGCETFRSVRAEAGKLFLEFEGVPVDPAGGCLLRIHCSGGLLAVVASPTPSETSRCVSQPAGIEGGSTDSGDADRGEGVRRLPAGPTTTVPPAVLCVHRGEATVTGAANPDPTPKGHSCGSPSARLVPHSGPVVELVPFELQCSRYPQDVVTREDPMLAELSSQISNTAQATDGVGPPIIPVLLKTYKRRLRQDRSKQGGPSSAVAARAPLLTPTRLDFGPSSETMTDVENSSWAQVSTPAPASDLNRNLNSNSSVPSPSTVTAMAKTTAFLAGISLAS